MNIQPITLQGQGIRLEPLHPRHAEDLAAGITSEIRMYMFTMPRDFTPDAMRQYIQHMNSLPNVCAFATIYQETHQAIGVTTYMDIQVHNRGLEIGSTWVSKAYHGTKVNPEAKYLMLRHAFEDQRALRVQLKTDKRNLQSQRAIEKLGAKHEGILRKHVVMPDGYIRDTVLYSITDDEWPEVKSQLEARLGYVP